MPMPIGAKNVQGFLEDLFMDAAKGLKVSLASLIAGEDLTNNLLKVAVKSTWSVRHQPAANTQATASQAAGGAGVKNVCQGFVVTLNAVAAQAGLAINIRDGATGAGTILAQVYLAAGAGLTDKVAVSGLWIEGTANTAMTIESAAAPAATNFAAVAMTGTTTQ